MLDSNFWNDSDKANKLVGELKNIKKSSRPGRKNCNINGQNSVRR